VESRACATASATTVVTAILTSALGSALAESVLAKPRSEAGTTVPTTTIVAALQAFTIGCALAFAGQTTLCVALTFATASAAAVVTALFPEAVGGANALARDAEVADFAGRVAATTGNSLMGTRIVTAAIVSAIVAIVAVVEYFVTRAALIALDDLAPLARVDSWSAEDR